MGLHDTKHRKPAVSSSNTVSSVPQSEMKGLPQLFPIEKESVIRSNKKNTVENQFRNGTQRNMQLECKYNEQQQQQKENQKEPQPPSPPPPPQQQHENEQQQLQIQQCQQQEQMQQLYQQEMLNNEWMVLTNSADVYDETSNLQQVQPSVPYMGKF